MQRSKKMRKVPKNTKLFSMKSRRKALIILKQPFYGQKKYFIVFYLYFLRYREEGFFQILNLMLKSSLMRNIQIYSSV